jgi:hypothetical protein
MEPARELPREIPVNSVPSVALDYSVKTKCAAHNPKQGSLATQIMTLLVSRGYSVDWTSIGISNVYARSTHPKANPASLLPNANWVPSAGMILAT